MCPVVDSEFQDIEIAKQNDGNMQNEHCIVDEKESFEQSCSMEQEQPKARIIEFSVC
jgi:hypothetical protein